MKKANLFFLAPFFIASLLLFYACQKNATQGNSGGSGSTTTQDVMVTASLQGRVLDEKGLPVQGAAVTSGTAVTTTDVNGVFNFSNIQMSSRFGYVKVVKQGYFSGSRSIVTHANAGNFVQISLLPRTSKGSFVSGSGGNVTVQGGNTVGFTGNSVVNKTTGSAYSGNVNVYAAYLDPTDSSLSQHMPGDLRGIDASNKETGLRSFGMVNVELEDDAGNALQVAPGQTATITMAIPSGLQASAPATIPLWYFNDTTGKWIEQGTATKQGNTYVGQVGHFTFWNTDLPSGVVFFKIYLKDQSGNPLSYTYLQFSSPSLGNAPGGGYTDTSGYAQGMIPEGVDVIMQVMNRCGEIMYQQDLGVTLADVDLGTVTVTQALTALTLTGTVVDCSNNPVANGYVSLLIEGLGYRAAVTNGKFTMSINRCSAAPADMQVIAADFSTNQQGSATTVSVTNGSKDLGQLTACGINTTQFFNIQLGDTHYSLTYPTDSIEYYAQGTTFNFWGTTRDGVTPAERLDFNVQNVTGAGTYSIPIFDFGVGNATYTNIFGIEPPVQFTITDYGPVNGYISGSVSGTLMDTVAKVSYPVSGTFNILRTN